MQDQSFQLLLNGVPYMVKASPFEFNGSTRFNIKINSSDEFIFTYDPSVKQFISLGDDAATIPSDLETAISGRLLALPVQ